MACVEKAVKFGLKHPMVVAATNRGTTVESKGRK
jgi:hypothetical protein